MNTDPTRQGTPRPILTFDDLTQDLVWPRLLRAGVLAFHPGRVLLAFIIVVLAAVVLRLLFGLQEIVGATGGVAQQEHLARLINPLLAPQGARAVAERLMDVWFSIPIQFARVHPIVALVGGPLVLVLLLIGAAAISRSAATEFAAGRPERLPRVVAFAWSRLASLLGATLGPLALVWVIALILALAGFVLSLLPGLNLLGAILYGVALLAGVLAMFVMFVYVAGKSMLIPSICCDGADAIDSIQRAYAYVLAKPLRLITYAAILIAQGIVLVTIVSVLFAGVVAFTARSTSRLTDLDARKMFYAERDIEDPLYAAGAWTVRAWNVIPAAVPLAFLFSYAACAGTMLYLAMRRVCDGQDMHELWSPEEDRDSALGAGALPGDDADAE